MSTDVSTEINEILENDISGRHSYFQMKYFIVNKEPTLQSKMWQCLREIKVRKEALENIQRELDDSDDRRELILIEIEKISFRNPGDDMPLELAEREKAIEIRRLKRQLKALDDSVQQLKRRLKETEEEAHFFCSSFRQLEQIEPLKPYDSLEVQTEYWNEKLSQEMNLRMMLHAPIDIELVKTVLALNDNAPIKKEFINIIEQRQKSELAKLSEPVQALPKGE